jgi:hypothetical protein
MRYGVAVVRKGVETPIEELGVEIGPIDISIGERSSFRCELRKGKIELGDWVQVYAPTGEPLGRYWYWGAAQHWKGEAISALDLGSSDRLLELAQVWSPGPIRGKGGDTILSGQPILAAVADICGDLGIELVAPALDRVAVSDYVWQPGTPLAQVVTDLLGSCGLRWTPGRRGEVVAYAEAGDATGRVEKDEVVELEIRPAWDRVANVVIVERRGGTQPAAGVTALWDDTASETSLERWVPRVEYVEAVPTETEALEALAQRILDERKVVGAEATVVMAVRHDIWPGDRLLFAGWRDNPHLLVRSVEWTEGSSTMRVEGMWSQLWDAAT